MTEKDEQANQRLQAISPLDGRYREKVEDLSVFESEAALIRTRFEVEVRYLSALSESGIIRPLTDPEKQTLLSLSSDLNLAALQRVKKVEAVTAHDIKAMERVFREIVHGTGLEDLTEMIHFGLTSEDVNNLAHRLMMVRARDALIVPALDLITESLADKALEYKALPILARTHGQAAVPTTLGKEIANVAVRLNHQVCKLSEQKLTGKLNGAVGNFNAHLLAMPEIDWINFSEKFVSSLGLEPNLFTTQINPYDDLVEMFQTLTRINGILLDLDQDLWRYISDGWFIQETKAGEVGSSTMPQKVNPINFENSEGNLQMANSLWEGMGRKLMVSRLQRDLSDSTTIRNVGTALGYGLLAYQNTLSGLNKIYPDIRLIGDVLNENWTILGEGVQTVLRKEGINDPYTLTAGLTRGKKLGEAQWLDWIQSLPVGEEVKRRLASQSPQSYLGYAERLTELALAEIAESKAYRLK